MKNFFLWFWHGEDVAKRIGFALLGAGGVIVGMNKFPETSFEWVGVGMGTLSGIFSRAQNGGHKEEPSATS